MPLILAREKSRWLLRMEGRITLASAGELKSMLLECLAARKDLELDLERVDEIDISILQMVSSAARDAARAGVALDITASPSVVAAARDAGFAGISGFPIQE